MAAEDELNEQVSPPVEPEQVATADSDEQGKDDDDWLDVLDNGQLKKKVIKQGDLSKGRPERACLVTISLRTKLQSTGEECPSETYDRQTGFVGDYDFMHGIDLAIPLMYIEEVATVRISDRFAYADLGRKPDIPANASLECELHLHECIWLDSENELPLQERIKFGVSKKERGNFWYQRDDYSTAIHCYRRAVELLDASDEEMSIVHAEVEDGDGEKQKMLDELKPLVKRLVELRATAYNNLAAAQLKTNALEAALRSVNNSLQLDETNVKALYRKGKILGVRGELPEAIAVLNTALKIEPSSRLIQTELLALSAKRKVELTKEKKMYERMIGNDPKTKEANAREKASSSSKLIKWGLVAGGVAVAAISAVAYRFA